MFGTVVDDEFEGNVTMCTCRLRNLLSYELSYHFHDSPVSLYQTVMRCVIIYDFLAYHSAGGELLNHWLFSCS